MSARNKTGFLPRNDAALLAWMLNFSNRISTAPTVYGLTAALASSFEEKYAAYQSAQNTATDPGTRTSPAIRNRDVLREAAKVMARQLAKLVEGTASVTDAQKLELGLTVRKKPTPIPAPASRTGVDLVGTRSNRVDIHIHDSASPSKTGKPAGAVAAWVYTYVGETYPSDPALWMFQGAATRGKYTVEFDASVPAGTQVWICAAWVNAKQETGPASLPVTTFLQYAGSNPLSVAKAA